MMRVVILAGGMGTRLQEETDTIPKPMVRIGERADDMPENGLVADPHHWLGYRVCFLLQACSHPAS